MRELGTDKGGGVHNPKNLAVVIYVRPPYGSHFRSQSMTLKYWRVPVSDERARTSFDAVSNEVEVAFGQRNRSR